MTAKSNNAPRRQRQRPFGLAAVVVWLLALAAGPVAAQVDLAEPDMAVDSAADSLAKRPRIAWYDPATDQFRAAEIKPPRQRNPWTGSSGWAEWLLRIGWVLLAALLVYLVYLIVKAFLQQEVGSTVEVERSSAGGDIRRVEQLPVPLAAAPDDFLAEAERLYRQGDVAQAIIYLFSHQLLQLDRRHWLRLVKGKTNRQYLREVRRSAAPQAAEVADLFESTVLLFEEVFFGKRLPPQDEIDAVWNNVGAFESLVTAREEQAA